MPCAPSGAVCDRVRADATQDLILKVTRRGVTVITFLQSTRERDCDVFRIFQHGDSHV